jgi:outer membrane protein assembly factor BamB
MRVNAPAVTGATALVLAAALALPVMPVSASAAPRPTGWSLTSTAVVGGPVLSDGKLLVVDVTNGHDLQLSALAPATGHVLWGTEISASYIPPVVLLDPAVVGGTALVLVPADGDARDRNVNVEGIDVGSGDVKWQDKQTVIVSDAPVTCDGGNDFCVAAFAPKSSSTTLAIINPATGTIETTVTGPARNLGMAPLGSSIKGNLWSTYSTAPSLVQLSPSGKVEWQQTVAEIFGGAQYNPNFGWDFAAGNNIDVGSVGYPETGGKLSLGDFKTVGISAANGDIKWSRPGFFMCGGTLQFLSTAVTCDFSGTVTERKPLQFSGLGLSFQGLDPVSGRVVWSEPVADPKAVAEAVPQPFVDGHHFVVQVSRRNWAVLDTEGGTTSPVGTGEAFWCEDQPGYKVTAPEGASDNGERSSEPVFSSCSATGAPAKGLPTSRPPAVGMDVDGLFIWLAPTGLRAVPLG